MGRGVSGVVHRATASRAAVWNPACCLEPAALVRESAPPGRRCTGGGPRFPGEMVACQFPHEPLRRPCGRFVRHNCMGGCRGSAGRAGEAREQPPRDQQDRSRPAPNQAARRRRGLSCLPLRIRQGRKALVACSVPSVISILRRMTDGPTHGGASGDRITERKATICDRQQQSSRLCFALTCVTPATLVSANSSPWPTARRAVQSPASRQFYPTSASPSQDLERFGCRVDFPAAKTCCGQSFSTMAFTPEAVRAGQAVREVFEPYPYVVTPSGELLRDGPRAVPPALRGDHAGGTG